MCHFAVVVKQIHVCYRYEVRVLVDDEEWGSSAADSRKVAKQEAARLTLNNLQQYNQVGIDVLVLKLCITLICWATFKMQTKRCIDTMKHVIHAEQLRLWLRRHMQNGIIDFSGKRQSPLSSMINFNDDTKRMEHHVWKKQFVTCKTLQILPLAGPRGAACTTS